MKKNLLALSLLASFACSGKKSAREILNVSYDPTREFYREFNAAFAAHWKHGHPGEDISFRMSHGGSGKQARSVIDGLKADVVTLALSADIDTIAAEAKLLPADWQKHLPKNSAPYTSTIVFLVRAGNPKQIRDWNDLVRPGVSVVTPNPKTSGGARYNYLAAYAYALKTNGNSDAKAREFIAALFKNVAVLDTGARGATTTFTQRKIGDVLIAWENEAYLAVKEMGTGLEIVTPSFSILAEPSVALVSENARANGTTELATAYLQHLYSDEGQNLAGRHYFRPTNAAIAKQQAFISPLKLANVEAVFGGWARVNKLHFADGGVFDQIYGK
ncbi:sulfate ABC transporter substrate-binding protein [Turneriella parva]|uniref:Sulfate ABC transporter, periplasmic sulfate-binding protein n=1 Tax=Turneriella parva (strain ATCC BAA-1111 / DSM 21527 / NCTC 11395 / H) TaxID=869212 RepID=I4BAR0_TURPD|nr:sulfate ABC transporter, periplasmic sulfate-binding protein [Turneriella parva DSM 21527]